MDMRPKARESSMLGPKARERLVVELLTRLHRYVRDSGAAAPIASYFEAYDPLSTGAVSIPAFRNALSSFRAPQFCLSTNDMEILAAHYSFGGDTSMISYLSLLDDMSKTPHHSRPVGAKPVRQPTSPPR